jgi:hypothetical protein
LLDACDGRPQESWRDILKVARSRFLIHIYYGTGALARNKQRYDGQLSS